MNRILKHALVASALTLAVPGMHAHAASASPTIAAQPPCQLFADDPYWDGGGYLVGTGGRIYCSSIRTVTVLLRQDRPWWPDRTLAEVTKTGSVVILDAKKYCAGGDNDMKVFTETRTNTGGKIQSGRILTTC